MNLTFVLALAGVSIAHKAALFASFVETLVHADRMHLERDRSLPPLYQSDVRYRHDPAWKDVVTVLETGTGDCKDLVSWRIAELREQGTDARVHVVFYRLDGLELFHLQVKTSQGVEDPSVVLGMKPVVVDASSH